MNSSKYYWYAIPSLLLIVSCTKFQYQTVRPSYVLVNEVTIKGDNGAFTSHNIRDVWIYGDDQYIGTMPLPGVMPLQSKFNSITLYPGIRNYGILSKPEIYVLMNNYKSAASIGISDTIYLKPFFTYKSGLQTYLLESFETNNIFTVDVDQDGMTSVSRTSQEFREGNYSGTGSVSADHKLLECATKSFTVASSSAVHSIYLELDFKSNINLSIGLINSTRSKKNYFLTLVPSTDWKKIYIPLYEIDGMEINSALQLALWMQSSDGQANGRFFIDNVRVISMP